MGNGLTRRRLLALTAGGAAASALGNVPPSSGRAAGTNILLLTVDDMGADTPGCFGGHPDTTPTLDRFARQGMSFHRAHVPIAVCQPCRSAIMTGRWPHRNGAEGFEPIRDDVPLLTDLLRTAGYRCGILGKDNHLAPVGRFGWDYRKQMSDLGMGRDPDSYGAATAQFIAEAAEAGQPWFLMANAHDPHRPFHGSDQEQQMFTEEQRATIPPPSRVFEPGEVTVPGFLPDLPDVRKEYAEYLSSSRRADDVVAAVLNELNASGVVHDTLVVFLSDNGIAFPFAKSNCYLQSTRTPLIIRWPGRIRAGRVDDEHFVSALDIFPTLCDAAGVDVPPGTDGRSLSVLLAGGTDRRRRDVVTVYHETSARRRYEMRCIQDERLGYIWNAWSDGSTQYRAENMTGRTWPAMTHAAETDADISARVDFHLHRTPEELYRLDRDPDALTNLAADPDYQDDVSAMRQRLLAWMRDVNDPLAARYALPPLDSFGPVVSPYETFSSTEAWFGQKDESFVIVANGSALWVDADEYGAIYVNDAAGPRITATTKVIYQENTNESARAGIMIKNDITQAGSSSGYVLVGVTAGRGFVMNWDSDGDGYVDRSQRVDVTRYPVWLRLVRDGSQVTGYYSADGDTWQPIATVQMTSPTEVQDIGIFATSINSAETSRADFATFDIQETANDVTATPVATPRNDHVHYAFP